MDSPSQFTFVDANSFSKRTTQTSPTAKSLIRSHAMQQVWEQRRLKRAREGRAEQPSEADCEKRQLEASTQLRLDQRRPFPETSRGNKGATKSNRKSVAERRVSRLGAVKDDDLKPDQSKKSDSKIDNRLKHSTICQIQQGTTHSSHVQVVQNRFLESKQPAESCYIRAASPSPRAVGMPLMDPFNTCAVQLGVKESLYINHYFQAVSWRFALPKKAWLQVAIHDSGLLHGILAIAAAHYSCAITRGLSNDAIYHHGKTIKYVQDRLGDPRSQFSDGVIGSIGRMVICHLIFGSREHFITHVRALQRCIEARGGLDNLGMTGQLKYVAASTVAAAATIWWNDVPLQLRYPYGALEYPAALDAPETETGHPEWGLGFHQLYERGIISDTLLDICDTIIAMSKLLDTQRSWTEPQQRIYGEQSNKLSYRLVYLREREDHDTWGKKTPEILIRDCVRQMLHFYMSAFQRDVPLESNICMQSMQNVAEILYRDDLEPYWSNGILGEVRLWMLIVSGAGSVRPQDRARAGKHLRRTTLQLGVTDWYKAREISHKFVYLGKSLDSKALPFWEKYATLSTEGNILGDIDAFSNHLSLVQPAIGYGAIPIRAETNTLHYWD